MAKAKHEREHEPEDSGLTAQQTDSVEPFVTAGALDSLETTVSCGITWSASKVDPVNGPLYNSGSRGTSTKYSAASGAANPATQQKVYRQILAASATGTLNLNAASANVCGDATAAFTKVEAFHVKLLSPTSAPGIVTAVCSGVHLAPGATNPIGLFLGGTSPTMKLKSDDEILVKTLAGFTVSPTACNVDITNEDATNQAFVEVTVTGLA